MENQIKVLLVGLGLLGQWIAEGILKKKSLRVVGAVDIAKDLVGKDLSETLGLSKKLGRQ